MSRRHFKREDFTDPAQLAAIDGKPSPDEALRVAALSLEDEKPAKGKQQGRGQSKNEQEYERHLSALVAAGEVVSFFRHPKPIELAHRCTFTADFLVYPRGEPPYCVEVKGRTGKGDGRPWYRHDARVKAKVAARVLSKDPSGPVALLVVWPKRSGRGWCSEVVKP